MRILGLIPARGGSKSVPRKNIRLLCNKPLLAYTAEAALCAHHLSHVILSTDDQEIAQIGRCYGLDVPFLRPVELAQDDTPTLPVIQHVIHFLESKGDFYDAVCLLQPTHPLRTAKLIDACIERFINSDADAVATVLPVPDKYNPHWVYFQDQKGFLHLSTSEPTPISRRQALPLAFHREGSVYVTKRSVLMEQNNLYGQHFIGYPLEPAQSVNIDTLSDWARAEELLKGQLK